jgi:hypothetical protein
MYQLRYVVTSLEVADSAKHGAANAGISLACVAECILIQSFSLSELTTNPGVLPHAQDNDIAPWWPADGMVLSTRQYPNVTRGGGNVNSMRQGGVGLWTIASYSVRGIVR